MSLSKLENNLLLFFQEHRDKSFKANDLASQFNYQGSKNYKKLVKALAFLEHIGEIEMVGQGNFRVAQNNNKLVGTFRANAKGFGFISVDPEKPDYFLPPGKVGQAMDGDTVEIRVLREVDPQTGKGSEAEVVRVVERAMDQVVGEFVAFNQDQRQDTGYIGYLIPRLDSGQSLRMMVDSKGLHPVTGSICLAEITQYPSPDNPGTLVGLITKEIGHKDQPGVDILEILYQFGIPNEFPEDVLEQIKEFPDVIDPAQVQGRHDLRDQLIITIDGASAKDLDDAISLEKNSDGSYELGVHIADVSHYVQKGSPIDQEAYQRGTSVYLTDRVVPMLPQKLSNGLCSLNPKEDRLTITCQMTINTQGKVTAFDIYLSVINSSYRMTYRDVNEILAGDAKLRQDYQEIVPMLEDMAALHKILEKMRLKRGALNFDTKEAEIIVDEEGQPQDIVVRQRQTGERMIESFMLAANETVAGYFMAKQLPMVYRIHEQPDEEKMLRFAEFASSLGVPLGGHAATIKPKQLQETLKKVQGQDFESVLAMIMLRSMQQAKYSIEPLGHYGLATKEYTHFTSPIRRYPDLMVHRLIHFYLTRPSKKEIYQETSYLAGAADQASKMERRAVDAERETDALKKAEFMADKIGQQFPGHIASVTSFGMFVELANTVEGLISLDKLSDDYYQFIPSHYMLVGERTSNVFKIGQKVVIEVEKVDISQRQIDFKLVDYESQKADQAALDLAQGQKRLGRRPKQNTSGNHHKPGKSAATSKGRAKNKAKANQGKPKFAKSGQAKGKLKTKQKVRKNKTAKFSKSFKMTKRGK